MSSVLGLHSLRSRARFTVLVFAALAIAGCTFEVNVESASFVDDTDADREVRAFLDEAVPKIFSPYNSNELFEYTVPEVAELAALFEGAFYAASLLTGDLEYFEVESGQVGLGIVDNIGEEGDLTAEYILYAEFEHGPGTIELGMIRRDGEWEITSWNVNLGD